MLRNSRSPKTKNPLIRGPRYIRKSINRIRVGGSKAFIDLIGEVSGLSFALFLFPVVFLLRPVVLVRFGRMPSHRIGALACAPEIFLSEKDQGMHSGRTLDLFFSDPECANEQLMHMWRSTVRFAPFSRYFAILLRVLPGGEKHLVPRRPFEQRDTFGVLHKTQCHIAFTEEEETRGSEALQELGIPHGTPFVCFHARDHAYLQNRLSGDTLGFHAGRDSNIQNYIPAVEELTRRGYYALRMGAVVAEALEVENPMIIDYASIGRSDFLDVYLTAKCTFYLGSSAGIDRVPMTFRVPSLHVNYLMLELLPTWGPDDICLPKKLWSREKQRFLTFPEILDSGIGRLELHHQFEELGLDVVENTPEEIESAVIEMQERLDGTWQAAPEDHELQEKFWSYFPTNECNSVFLSRVGANFLRCNSELFG